MVRTLVLALLGWIALPGAAAAASFDCAKASAPDEEAVCSDPRLSALDSEMAGLWYAYSKVPMLMGASGVRQDDAIAFLERRRRCGSSSGCIASAYEQRIAALEAAISRSMADMAPFVTGGCACPNRR